LSSGPVAGDDVGAIPSPRGAHDMVFAAEGLLDSAAIDQAENDAINAKALA
jgi:hypothetical protein